MYNETRDKTYRMLLDIHELLEECPVALTPGYNNAERELQYKYYTSMGEIFIKLGLFNSRININDEDEFEPPMSTDPKFNHDRVTFFYNYFINPPFEETSNVKITPMNLPNSQETFNIVGNIMNNYISCLTSPTESFNIGTDDEPEWDTVIVPLWQHYMFPDGWALGLGPEPTPNPIAENISEHFKNFRKLVTEDFNYTIDTLYTMIETT